MVFFSFRTFDVFLYLLIWSMEQVQPVAIHPAQDSTIASSRGTWAQPGYCEGWTFSWYVFSTSSKQQLMNCLMWEFHSNPCVPTDIFSMNSPHPFLNSLALLASAQPFTILLYTHKQVLFLFNLLSDHLVESSLLLVFQETMTSHFFFSISSMFVTLQAWSSPSSSSSPQVAECSRVSLSSQHFPLSLSQFSHSHSA